MKPQDSIKEWFKILEERGEYSHFTVIEETHEGRQIETDFFHGNKDGIGGFLSIMKSRGETDFLLPELPKRDDPSWFVYAINFFRYCARLPFYSPDWKISAKWGRKSEKPSARAWCSLSVSDTDKIWKKAKEAGVGRNAFLLYHLNQAIQPLQDKTILPNYWLIPVNLRPDFKSHEGNITGFIDARITKKTSVKDLDSNLRKALLRGEALGGYVGITLGRFLGPSLLKVLVFMNDFIQTRTGVFTNLGNWKTAPGTEMKSHWFGFPPVIKAQPFGAMTGSMNGEQSFTVIFHPSLTRDKKVAEEVLKRWTDSLLA